MRLRHCILHAAMGLALTLPNTSWASGNFERLAKAAFITGAVLMVLPPEITRNASTYVRAANEGLLTAKAVPQAPSQPIKLFIRADAAPVQLCMRERRDGYAVAEGVCAYWIKAESTCVLVAPNGQTTHHIVGQLYAACLRGVI